MLIPKKSVQYVTCSDDGFSLSDSAPNFPFSFKIPLAVGNSFAGECRNAADNALPSTAKKLSRFTNLFFLSIL